MRAFVVAVLLVGRILAHARTLVFDDAGAFRYRCRGKHAFAVNSGIAYGNAAARLAFGYWHDGTEDPNPAPARLYSSRGGLKMSMITALASPVRTLWGTPPGVYQKSPTAASLSSP